MTGIDGATAARPETKGLSSRPDTDGFLSDVLASFNAEFFVEWQVADHEALTRLAGASEAEKQILLP